MNNIDHQCTSENPETNTDTTHQHKTLRVSEPHFVPRKCLFHMTPLLVSGHA